VELKECSKGHYSEHTNSGRCKDCISEYNEEFKSDTKSIERSKRLREWHEERNSYLTEDNFDERIKKRNYFAKARFSKQGHEEIENFKPEDIRYLLEIQSNECAACFVSFDDVAFEIDHIRPVGIISSNSVKNLQLLCKSCNNKKYNSCQDDFMSKMRYNQVMDQLSELQEEYSYFD